MRSMKTVFAVLALVAATLLVGCQVTTEENLYSTIGGDTLPLEESFDFTCRGGPMDPDPNFTDTMQLIPELRNGEQMYAMFFSGDPQSMTLATFHHMTGDTYLMVEPRHEETTGQTIYFVQVTSTSFRFFYLEDLMKQEGAEGIVNTLNEGPAQINDDGVLTGEPDAQRAFLAAAATHVQTAVPSVDCTRNSTATTP